MENYITQDKIKVKCNAPVNQILKLSVQECIGKHSVARIEAMIEAGSMQLSCLELNSQPLSVCFVNNDKEQQLFTGVITDVCIEKKALYDIVIISANSLSWFMDLEKKSRSFQKGEKTILEILNKIAKENSFELLCSAEEREVAVPFIQYRETDWEFLLRLSTYMETPVLTANEYGGKGIYIGFQDLTEPYALDTVHEVWGMDEEQIKSPNWKGIGNTYYQVIAKNVLHIGQCVQYQKQTLWVHEVSISLAQGVLQGVYILADRHYKNISPIFNPYMQGLSLMGTVLTRKEEFIQIHLDIDEEQDLQYAHLYPWIPEYGNVVYCMPEEGSRVRLFIPNGQEQQAIGINCVRLNSQQMESPSNRYVVTPSQKKLALLPDSMEISSKEGESIVSIQDSTGNVINSKGTISIQAKGKLQLSGKKINLNAPTEITIVKRQLGKPAVVNICYNLDSMGEFSTFKKINKAGENIPHKNTVSYQGMDLEANERNREDIEKEREKLQFKLKELMEKDSLENTYEFGSSILNIISAVPQGLETEQLSQIALGFRPIAGRMRGE